MQQIPGQAVRNRVREAVAELLHGKSWNMNHLASVAVLDDGRWFSYPHSGNWRASSAFRVSATKDEYAG